MKSHLLTILRVSLALFLLIATVLIVATTRQTIRSAESLADLALQSTALALASSAEGALIQGGDQAVAEIREIFSDRVVAYAALTDRQGEVLFHTNPRLVGSRLPQDEVAGRWPSGKFLARRIVLGTGLPGYEFNRILDRPEGGAQLLSLVLHTTPVDPILRGALRMWWAVGGVLIMLWAAGILSERIVTRQVRMQAELDRRRQLALVGQMTAVLAHEIRNALGSMKGYAQWVDEKVEMQDPKKAGLSVILRGVARIESLVNGLLLFSCEEVYHIEPLDPAEMIKEALDGVTLSWRGKVELDLRSGEQVFADKEKLNRALMNGIRNAVQAMGEHGELHISVRSEGRWVRVRIADSGAGIPGEEMPFLFTPFHTTKTDGTGLGLAYSKKVLEGMGGTIELGNREGKVGAVLTLGLPKAGERESG